MDTWQFYLNDKAQWCWKHVAPNGFMLESETCFASRTDCIADAMRHGYLSRGGPSVRHGLAAAVAGRRLGEFTRA